MALQQLVSPFGRRNFLSIAAGAAGAVALTGGRPAAAAASPKGGAGTQPLPVADMQKILGATGTVTNGVLSVDIVRTDLSVQLPGNIPANSQLAATMYFQPALKGQAILNGDFALTAEETNPFIDALIAGGLKVQAFHQHIYDLTPTVWFIHYRGHMEPLALARAIRKAMDTTGVKLPQSPPPKTTPFDTKRLETILGGTADIGPGGVVTVSVPRKETTYIDKARIQPETGISSTIEFQPLSGKAGSALVVPDFALIGHEVNPVFKTMRAEGFDIGCLYNQETDELPQLYFSHMWKTGNPYELARSVRKGLMLTNSGTAG